MNDKNQAHNPNRRSVLKKITGLGTVALCAPFVITPSKGLAQSKQPRIIIRTTGGHSHQIYTEMLFKPFAKASGIEVIGVPSNAEPTAEIKSMVNAKNYNWHMACLSHRAIQFLGSDYLEPHRLENDPTVATIMPQFISPYGVGYNVYTAVLAYRTDAFKGRQPPKTWQDFWDVKNFAGRRGLRKAPFETIEQALLADGVPPSQVYPCDLDRAFRSLDKIKPHISVWWHNAPETEQLLKSGEVDLIPAFSNRVLYAIHDGAPVDFSWEQHIYACDSWAILKGTPNADACREFIKFASAPQQQALLAPYGTAPTQPEVLKPGHVDLKHAKLLSTYPNNLKKGVFSNAAYWASNQSSIIERFNHWLLN